MPGEGGEGGGDHGGVVPGHVAVAEVIRQQEEEIRWRGSRHPQQAAWADTFLSQITDRNLDKLMEASPMITIHPPCISAAGHWDWDESSDAHIEVGFEWALAATIEMST